MGEERRDRSKVKTRKEVETQHGKSSRSKLWPEKLEAGHRHDGETAKRREYFDEDDEPVDDHIDQDMGL